MVPSCHQKDSRGAQGYICHQTMGSACECHEQGRDHLGHPWALPLPAAYVAVQPSER